MKSFWVILISRFWPGFFGLVVTFVVLTWILQPRPRAIETKPLPLESPLTSREKTIRSANNHYVATVFSTNDPGGIGTGQLLTLHDNTNSTEVFRSTGQFMGTHFEPAGTLVFQSRPYMQQGPVPIHEQLVRWNPAAKTQTIVWEYHLPAKKFSELELNTSYLPKEDQWPWTWSLLSPDARTWIVPCFDEQKVWYEWIDIASGKSGGRLELPELSCGSTPIRVRGMRFIDDGDILLVHTTNQKKTDDQLHWLHARTGRQLSSMPIPGDMIGLSFASKNLVVGTTHRTSNLTEKRDELLIIHYQEKQVQRIRLDEIQPEKQERPKDVTREYVNPGAMIHHSIDPDSNTLVTSWSYYFSEARRWGDSITLPEFHYSVRDLKTGSLLRTDSLRFPSGKKGYNPFWVPQVSLQSVLPGPILMLSRHRFFPENQLMEWVDWVQQKLNLPRDALKATYCFIDGRSGKTLWNMQFPIPVWKVALSHYQTRMTVSNNGDEQSYLYDYPLHSPWHLICSWAFGVAIVITLLVELNRWRKRRKASVTE